MFRSCVLEVKDGSVHPCEQVVQEVRVCVCGVCVYVCVVCVHVYMCVYVCVVCVVRSKPHGTIVNNFLLELYKYPTHNTRTHMHTQHTHIYKHEPFCALLHTIFIPMKTLSEVVRCY